MKLTYISTYAFVFSHILKRKTYLYEKFCYCQCRFFFGFLNYELSNRKRAYSYVISCILKIIFNMLTFSIFFLLKNCQVQSI